MIGSKNKQDSASATWDPKLGAGIAQLMTLNIHPPSSTGQALSPHLSCCIHQSKGNSVQVLQRFVAYAAKDGLELLPAEEEDMVEQKEDAAR